MKRLLRIRLTLLLFALVAIPLATLPFAERLRSEWAKFWEPRLDATLPDETIDPDDARRRAFLELIRNFEARRLAGSAANPIFVSGGDVEWIDVEELQRESAPDPPPVRIPFKSHEVRGESAGAVDLDVPRFGENP